jgi:phosphomannomutase
MASLDPKIFKSYDIRGIYPTDINEENLPQIANAVYSFLLKKLNKDTVTIALGCDMRTSAPALYPILKETLLQAGATIIDLGMVSTPTFYFAVSHFTYETGIQLTASHNPKEWTGMKFVVNGEKGLLKIGKPTGMEDVKQMAIDGITPPPHAPGSITEKKDIVKDEVTSALANFGNPTFKHFKVVADPGNAMGGTFIEELYNQVPAELIKMNFELDGTFPVHQPDPLQFSTLVELQKRVLSEQADFGLAPDGDGDRIFFIDEKGQIIPGTMMTALVAREFLKEHPGEKILFDVRNILTPSKIVEENGGTYEITKVGHAFITEALTKTGGIFAGEGSCHFYYRATGNAESSVMTIITLMKVLSDEQKPLSEIIEDLRRSYESPETNFKVENAPEILAHLKEVYSDGELSELDGVTFTYPEWRCNIRTSNTEPLLRVNIEAFDRSVLEQKREELISNVKSVAKELPGDSH